MKILYLNPVLPEPGNNDFNTRSYYLLRQVAQQHAITAVAFAPHNKNPAVEYLQQFCESYYQIQQKRMLFPRLPQRFFSKVPVPILQMNQKLLRRTIADLLAQENFDVVHCGHAGLLPALPHNLNIPVLLQQDTLSAALFLAQIQANGRQKQRSRTDDNSATEAFLRQMWAQADGIFVATSAMKTHLHSQAPNSRVFIVPPGVNAHYFVNDGGIIAAKTIVLPGAFHDKADREAMQYFVRQIWGLLHRRDPEIRLLIVGQGAADEIRTLNRMKNIYVAGGVTDPRKIINEATTVVFPHRSGEHVNVQVLKALSQSKAVVATPHATNGLELVDGQNICIADSADEFVQQIINLTSDGFQRRVLSVQARAAVEAFHAWDVVVKSLLQIYSELVAQAAALRTIPAEKVGRKKPGQGEAVFQ